MKKIISIAVLCTFVVLSTFSKLFNAIYSFNEFSTKINPHLKIENKNQTEMQKVIKNEGQSISEKIKDYLKSEKISEIEEEIFNSFTKKGEQIGIDKISSDRYIGEKPTEIEKKFDFAVDEGDIPIEKFTLAQIDCCKSNLENNNNKTNKPEFILVRGQDAMHLYDMDKNDKNPSIVQIASQFNALESVSDEPSAVKYWIYDHTQGPRASLQSILACKHRESAHLKNKLPDAIKDLLEKCKLKNGKSILEKYRNLYKNGYLKLFKIMSNEDLEILKNFLAENIGDLNFLSQWVICNENNVKQLHVFSAAPSFQGDISKSYWTHNFNNSTENLRRQLLKEISKIIVVSEYKALAQVAAIRSQITGKQASLHLTLVGQGAFNNSPEIVKEALMEIKKELKGANVKVYLHGYNETKSWEDACESIGINLTRDFKIQLKYK